MTLTPKSQSALRKYGHPHFFFLVGALIVISINASELLVDVATIEQRKSYTPFYFLGFKFSGLDDILKGTKYVGYYTDKDLSATFHSSQFTQAQFILAPAILDLNNTKLEFILFDCASDEIALAKIAEIGATPLQKNKFGIILAQNKI